MASLILAIFHIQVMACFLFAQNWFWPEDVKSPDFYTNTRKSMTGTLYIIQATGGLAQDCGDFIAIAIESPLYCAKTSMQ